MMHPRSTLNTNTSIQFYDEHAVELSAGYETVPFANAHPFLHNFLTRKSPMKVLDVGAGSGRDAAGISSLGHDVFAVEPSTKMRSLAQQLHPSGNIHWIGDSLPWLSSITRKHHFDVIILSAVWMHIAPADRIIAEQRLIELLAPKGIIYITLRVGPAASERGMYRTASTTFQRMGRRFHLKRIDLGVEHDLMGRPGITWRTIVLESGSPDSQAERVI